MALPQINSSTSADIPVVKLSSPSAAVDLLNAAATYGFVFVENEEQDIPTVDVKDMFDLSNAFFKLPTSSKEEFSMNAFKSGKNRGWVSMHAENLDPAKHKRGDFKEAFNIGEFIDGSAQQHLPEALAKNESRIGAFADRCHSLCNRILELFAIGLEIPEGEGGQKWFAESHDRSKGTSGSVLRLLYYPALPPDSTYNPEVDIRAGAHSDYGSITLLFQLPGQPGLEILTASGSWSPVPVNPTNLRVAPILVNIGDLLSYWTNGLLKSTVHRVIQPLSLASSERFSIAYFCHPLDSARLVPVPSKAVAQHARDGIVGHGGGAGVFGQNDVELAEALTARDHLNRRLAVTYGSNSSEEGK